MGRLRVYGPRLTGDDEGKCAGCRQRAATRGGYCRVCADLQQTGELWCCCVCGRREPQGQRRGLCAECCKEQKAANGGQLPQWVKDFERWTHAANQRERRRLGRIARGWVPNPRGHGGARYGAVVRFVHLDPEQWEGLEPILKRIVEE